MVSSAVATGIFGIVASVTSFAGCHRIRVLVSSVRKRADAAWRCLCCALGFEVAKKLILAALSEKVKFEKLFQAAEAV